MEDNSQTLIREELEKIVEDPTFICTLHREATTDEKFLVEDIVRKSTPEERMALLEKDPRIIEYFANPSLGEQKYVILNLEHWKRFLKYPDDGLEDYRFASWLYRLGMHPSEKHESVLRNTLREAFGIGLKE